MNTIRQSIEQFHLIFLDQLSRNLDNKLFAVKGGCNLRFFFHSLRYSEDLDIDVHTIAVNTLKHKVDKLLKSATLHQILRTRHLTVSHVGTPKQTDTTQRWKITLLDKHSIALNTKIEFSRRQFHDGVAFEPVEPELIQQYRLMPFLCPHYEPVVAITQKIEALAGRAQTQARDIFDLYFLMALKGVKPEKTTLTAELIETAQNNLMTIAYQDYKSQVVAYLSPETQSQFGSQPFWDRLLENVMSALENIKREIT